MKGPDKPKLRLVGVGPDAETVVNEAGGKQSEVPARLDLLPAMATLRVGVILKAGAEKYGEDNWRAISVDEHLNHALIHIYAFLAGDGQDDHVGHAACRALMALEMFIASRGPEAQGGPSRA